MKELGGKTGVLVGLDLPSTNGGNEAEVQSPHWSNWVRGETFKAESETDNLWQPKWYENQTVLATAIHTPDRDAGPLEGIVAGNWSLGTVEQSQGKGCFWLKWDGLKGCEGGDCDGKCLWMKAGQPWKQGNTAKSRVVGGAIIAIKFKPQLKPRSSVARSDQSLSRVWFFATPWISAHQASLSIINSRSSLRLTSIQSVMPSSHLILCRPLLLWPPIPPSIRVFSNESTLRIRWPKYWSFTLSLSLSNEHPGLVSFRMDWLDLLAVQGTLKSLLQHHSSKASILRHSALFMIQLSHPYMTTGKTVALTIWTFLG